MFKNLLLALALSAAGFLLVQHHLMARWAPPNRLSPFERAKAERLLATRLPCLGCHVIDGKGGRVGPNLTDVGKRLTRQGILQRISEPRTVQPGSLMPTVEMPAPWRDLLVRYLTERGADVAESGATPLPVAKDLPLPPITSGEDGARIYGKFCASCHGESGRGDGPNAPFLPAPPSAHNDSAVMGRRSDDALFDTIAGGGYIMNRHPFMPPYGNTLSSAQIRAVVRYIRVLCSCRGPSWSADGERGAR